ncbi:amidohydrolase family protein [Bosea sp. 685]|uniref:amidohydrolase family protein n=1 Tax=Bosea sp. 685 TaxID=3080057 RepID=UPI002892DA32|nr:amidohydrolase family protein [Bosea sp. 685]WNJ88859.1 amidohydrolase family protein [Bosea sp. 685]
MPIYSGPIIDPHMHLWDVSMGRHPWLKPSGGATAVSGLESIRRNFLTEDYRQASMAHDVVASVHVEALWDPADPGGELAWLDTLDKRSGVAARYVGSAPFGTKDALPIIERESANPRLNGFRAIISHHPTNPAKSWAKSGDVVLDPAWRRDVALLAKRGLTLDLMMYPYQAEGVAALARACPDLQIVVNHSGSPIDRDEDGLARWREAVRRLADAPNIAIKVNMVGYDPNPTYEAVKDMALHCIACFGPGRTLFASDWPVSTRYIAYGGIFDHFKRMTAGFSPDEQTALFHGNAARLYRVQPAPRAFAQALRASSASKT